jgi:hypothetical protein
MIHRLLLWTLWITAPEVVKSQFLRSVLPGMTVGGCGRPASVLWDEPPSLRDTYDCLGMTVAAVDRPDK